MPNRQYRVVPNRLDVRCVHVALNAHPSVQDDDGQPNDDPNGDLNGDPNGDGADSEQLHSLQSAKKKTKKNENTIQFHQ